jgi:hypothetical protein
MESTAISTQQGLTLFIDRWDDTGAWLSIQTPYGGTHCTLTADEAKRVVVALQAALEKVAA